MGETDRRARRIEIARSMRMQVRNLTREMNSFRQLGGICQPPEWIELETIGEPNQLIAADWYLSEPIS